MEILKQGGAPSLRMERVGTAAASVGPSQSVSVGGKGWGRVQHGSEGGEATCQHGRGVPVLGAGDSYA